MKATDQRDTGRKTTESSRPATRRSEAPFVEIFFSMTDAPSPFGGTETYTFSTSFSIPSPIPMPAIIPAVSAFGDQAKIIRWRSDKPFVFFPDDSNDWRAVPGHHWKFIPRRRPWFAVFSLPSDEKSGYFLDLRTRNSKCTPDYAGYRMLGLEDLAFSKEISSLLSKKTELSIFKKLIKFIKPSLASKATIIISE